VHDSALAERLAGAEPREDNEAVVGRARLASRVANAASRSGRGGSRIEPPTPRVVPVVVTSRFMPRFFPMKELDLGLAVSLLIVSHEHEARRGLADRGGVTHAALPLLPIPFATRRRAETKI
jgi:hypothetical protein